MAPLKMMLICHYSSYANAMKRPFKSGQGCRHAIRPAKGYTVEHLWTNTFIAKWPVSRRTDEVPVEFLYFICIVNAFTTKKTTINLPVQWRNLGVLNGWFGALVKTNCGFTAGPPQSSTGVNKVCSALALTAALATQLKSVPMPLVLLHCSRNRSTHTLLGSAHQRVQRLTDTSQLMMTWWCKTDNRRCL